MSILKKIFSKKNAKQKKNSRNDCVKPLNCPGCDNKGGDMCVGCPVYLSKKGGKVSDEWGKGE